MRRLHLTLPALVLAASSAGAQQFAARGTPAPLTSVVTATAVRTDQPVLIDGRDADEAWTRALVIDQFRQFVPKDDAEPTFRTEARVAYDDRNLYVLVRAFDAHPDSIMALLSRRDERTQSDYIRVVVDSYHDKRTGYQFAVNPAGVKRDIYLYNDSEEDESWDAVWDVKTSIDSLGWVAEFRIPLSQLRYPRRASHAFGIGIHREIGRLNERMAWPTFSRNKFGIASQLGEVRGIDGISSPRRLEVLPYAVQKNMTEEVATGYAHPNRSSFGADIKYGLSSSLTLDATVNPDFGQVEADPSVLNLSAFEQFYQEKRPFFLEGSGLFRYDMNCNDGQCTGLFYSRRIGRAPQLGYLASDANDVPISTTILGAAKLTGRLGRGVSLGLLNAVTAREAVGETTLEPRTNYLVGSLQKDFRAGLSGVSGMVTAVNRDLDDVSALSLRSDAYTGGLELRHRFGPSNSYRLGINVAGSLVHGSASAIAATQRSSIHNFQRPDDNVAYDPSRTRLGGTWAQIGLNKSAGKHTRFWTGIWAATPGFEYNDMGFQQNANTRGNSNWLAFVFNEPRAFYRQLQVNVNQWNVWSPSGELAGQGGNLNLNTTLKSQWFMYAGFGGEVPSLCLICARGGPAIQQSTQAFWWSGIRSDQRKSFSYGMNVNGGWGDEGHSHRINVGPELALRVASRFKSSLGINYSRDISDGQWLRNYGAVASDTTHFTFARLDQRLVSITSRVDYTVSPTLSVQLYASPFATSGDYTNWREVSAPRAASYGERFRPFTQTGPASASNFNFKEFRSNSVVRWEYRPGSTLYFVWSQGRQQSGIDAGTFGVNRDLRNLFDAHPINIFLIKASYWLSL